MVSWSPKITVIKAYCLKKNYFSGLFANQKPKQKSESDERIYGEQCCFNQCENQYTQHHKTHNEYKMEMGWTCGKNARQWVDNTHNRVANEERKKTSGQTQNEMER